MKLKVLGLGIGMGVVWGVTVFLATAIDILKKGGMHLGMLKVFYLGYDVTWPGALIGFGWAFLTALVAGIILALIYNLFAAKA